MATEAEHLRLHLALTEIRDNTVQAVINKDVGAFEIPMHNPTAVEIPDTFSQLGNLPWLSVVENKAIGEERHTRWMRSVHG